MSHRLSHPPSTRADTAAKKGGVAPVLPLSAGAARAGRAIADMLQWDNEIEK